MIRLFVGLGNPGPEYEDTRHNAGFWFIDELARRFKVSLQPDRAYHGLVARANLPQGPVWLLQPMTYMNVSGKAVAPLARFFKIEPSEILVVHDELDIAPGDIKLKQGGGNGGHNGLKDIQAQMGSGDFWRLRLGIGHPGIKHEVAAYVLRKPPSSEREAIFKSMDKGLDAVDTMLAGDMAQAVRKVHAQPPRPKPVKPEAAPGASASAPDDLTQRGPDPS
jgi:PTH1 family peptidyl-tRNA hydrolase